MIYTTIARTQYVQFRKGTPLLRVERKALSKRRRRILGMGRKTPNQLKQLRGAQ